jgi:hypothetical protein
VKKFNQILSLYVEDNIDLVKVRLKVDPKDRNIVDYKDFDGYEGYILKEGTYYNVFFLQENLPVLQVPFSIISVTDIEDTNKFDTVKMAALKLLHKKGCLTDSKIRKIGMCNEVEFFEQYLREEGITDSEIKDLYKNNLFENVLTEKVNWGRLAGLAAAGVFAPGYAADVVAGKAKEKLGKIFDPKRGIFSDDKKKAAAKKTAKKKAATKKAKEKLGKVFDPTRGIFSDDKYKGSSTNTASSTSDSVVAKKAKGKTGETFGKIFGNDEDPNKKQYGTSSGDKGLTISPNRYKNAGTGNLLTILKSDFYNLSRQHVQQGKVVETEPKSNKFVPADNKAVFEIDLEQDLIKANSIPYNIDDIAKSDPSKLGLVMAAYSKGDFKGFLDRLKDITPAEPSAPTSSSTASVQATTPGAINVSSTPSSNSATTAPSTTASTATIS